ncbi:uncharacterized protein [Aristolochia californica]|uniref:uncharacterized protein n=1 Tax=Aristolochia californica TaxID=171875 RepID=UPI0035E2EB1C
MATEMGRAHCDWPQHEELSNQNDCQVLDHGSISFGRFAVESLSWEKWSVFSHNRCKEELEKFRAPGLVAQKKAYFEEYYRKIRVLKALQSQQDEQTMDSGDSSVCSQGPEDEQTTARAENSIDGQDVDVVQAEEDAIQVSAEQDMIPVAIPLVQHLEPHSILSCTGSPKSSKEGIKEEIENPRNNNLHESMVSVNFNNKRVPEAEQLKKYEHLDDGRIKIEENHSDATVQYETSVVDVMYGGSSIKKENNLAPARVEVNHKRNENLSSVAKKTSLGKHLPEAVHLGKCMESLKHNAAEKESSAVTVRNSMRAELNKGIMPKSLVGLKYPLHKVPGKEESRIKLSKTTVNNTKKYTPSFSHKPLKEDANVTSVERNAKVQTRKSKDATKSAQGVKHPVPEATNSTKNAINSRLGASNAHSTLNKLQHPVPETTRRTKGAISSHVGTSYTHSSMNKSISVSANRQCRGISSFSSCRSSERRSGNRDGAQNSSHSGFSNILVRSSVDAKNLSLREHMSAGQSINCGIRDTTTVNRRCVNLSLTKSNMNHTMEFQLGRNDRESKKREETGAALLRQPCISSNTPLLKQTFLRRDSSKSDPRRVVPWRSVDLVHSGRKRV